MNYVSSMYMLELNLRWDDAQSGAHSGSCDADIAALRKVPYVAAQLEFLDPEKLSLELKEYGAWDEDERSDHDANLSRFLWLACADIVEQNDAPTIERCAWNVTFSTVTEDSAKEGDYAENGFVIENATLREALQSIDEHATGSLNCAEYCDGYLTFYYVQNYYGSMPEDVLSENITLHIPEYVHDDSAKRLAKLLGASVH